MYKDTCPLQAPLPRAAIKFNLNKIIIITNSYSLGQKKKYGNFLAGGNYEIKNMNLCCCCFWANCLYQYKKIYSGLFCIDTEVETHSCYFPCWDQKTVEEEDAKHLRGNSVAKNKDFNGNSQVLWFRPVWPELLCTKLIQSLSNRPQTSFTLAKASCLSCWTKGYCFLSQKEFCPSWEQS